MATRARKSTSEMLASKKTELKNLSDRIMKLKREIKVLEAKESDIYSKKISSAIKKSRKSYDEILNFINGTEETTNSEN